MGHKRYPVLNLLAGNPLSGIMPKLPPRCRAGALELRAKLRSKGTHSLYKVTTTTQMGISGGQQEDDSIDSGLRATIAGLIRHSPNRRVGNSYPYELART